MYQIENDDLKVILSDTGGLVRIYNKLTGQENLFSDCGFSLVSDLAKKNLEGHGFCSQRNQRDGSGLTG